MKVLALSAAFVLAASAAGAQQINIGIQIDPSIDPHFLYLGNNVAVWKHLYASLTDSDENGRPVPRLAESWRLLDDTTWEFKLRGDVKFSDGTPLTADDVVFSLKRVSEVPRNPSPYTPRMETITGIEAKDPRTVVIKTSVPNPLVPENMYNVAIVSKKAAEGKATADFTSGAAAVALGPYKFVSFTPGDKLVVERNPGYFGEKPHWERVTFKVITNDAARVAALLSGDVDFIEFVPPADLGKLRTNPQVAIHEGPSGRVINFVFNYRQGSLPTITDLNGTPLPQNPMRDVRVRRAIYKAIDRDAIVARIMDNAAIPANQMAAPYMLGFDPSIPPAKYDAEGAKNLLREAGFPQGFALTISCPNNRYPNDERICQAVGQMLSRVGLKTNVDTAPMAVFMNKLRGTPTEPSAVPMGLLGLASGTQPSALPTMAHSTNAQIGRGQYNFTGFGDKALDDLIDDGLTTLDEKERSKKLQQAMRKVTEDVIILPIHFQKTISASRRDLTFTTGIWEETAAWKILPRK